MKESHSFLQSYVEGETAFGFWGAVTKGLTAVNAFLIISSLDVFHYGIYVLILAFYTLVSGSSLRTLSGVIFNDIARFISEGKDSEAKKLFWETFYVRMGIALFLSLGLFLGADIIAVLYDEDIAAFLRIISPIFLIEAFHTALYMYLKARLQFTVLAFRPIIHRVTTLFILFFFLFFFELGIREALYAYVISSFVGTLVFILVFVETYKPWLSVRKAERSVFLNVIKVHGKWSIFNSVLSQATSNLKPWLIKFFVNTEAVAIFSVAESFFGAVKSFIPTSTLSTLIPREVTEGKKMRRILLSGTKYLALFSIVLGVGAFLLVPPIIYIFLPHYNDSILLFQVMLFALPILTFRIMGSTFLVALRKQKYLFFVSIIRTAANLLFPIVLLSLVGVLGMAFERILLAVLTGGLMYGYLLRYKAGRGFWRELFTITKDDIRFAGRVIRSTLLRVRFVFGRTPKS